MVIVPPFAYDNIITAQVQYLGNRPSFADS